MILVIIISLIGCGLTTLQSRKLRLIGFALACLSAGIWMGKNIYVHDYSAALQFATYVGINILGVWFNRKDMPDKKS